MPNPILRRGQSGPEVLALQQQLNKAGAAPHVPESGVFQEFTRDAVVHFQKNHGLKGDGIVGDLTRCALQTPCTAPVVQTQNNASRAFAWNPSPLAMAQARSCRAGQAICERTPQFADIYKKASELTGVPAEMIAALHANESAQGDCDGPEAGFGLDPRFVSAKERRDIVAEYGIPAGTMLSCAVVAGELLRRTADHAGVDLEKPVSAKDAALIIRRYAGTGAYFDLSAKSCHPYHPGGTSVTDAGTIKIAPGYKVGLLRWDVLLPLLHEQLSQAN
jgi:hypothetical protein